MQKAIMDKLLKNNGFLILLSSIAFIGFSVFSFIKGNYFFLGIPLALIIILWAFTALDKLIWFTIFFVPISLPISEFIDGVDIDMFLPTEPLLAGILFLFLILIPTKRFIDKEILSHPITKAISLLMAWMAITTILSTMPLVSFKYLLMRLWFVVVFYYLLIIILKNTKKYERLVWLYAIPMVIVIIYASYRVITTGAVEEKIAHWASNPFFKDHTIYGASLAFFLPFILILSFNKHQSKFSKISAFTLLGFFTLATILSYSRAAWLSLIGALAFYIIIRYRIKWRYIFIIAGIGIAIIVLSWTKLVMKLESNDQDSAIGNLGDHVRSITNISSDASNLERLNRWNSAFRMFVDKPFLGFGPGTYMFKYASYQMSYEKTIISTNAGDMGNAHSEYFGPLSEQGLFGMFAYLGLVITILMVSIRRYYEIKDKKLKQYLLGSLLGLVTYFLHSFLNNFLDTDKVSAPFWGFTAIIVAIDLYDKKQSKNKEESSIETQNQIG
jgi:putative inorganic carbon (HCO3(-)) transporter